MKAHEDDSKVWLGTQTLLWARSLENIT